jgi:DNA-binding transcriptional LysR family regulator
LDAPVTADGTDHLERDPTGLEGDDVAAARRRLADSSLRDAMLLKIPWLRSFLAVAESGGFGAATTTVHLSQSRISAHIAALEELLGFALFERRVRPTTLTPSGRIFAGYAKRALEELQEGVESARGALRPGYQHLVVGSYPSVSSVFLPSVLTSLRVRHPELSIELVEGTAASLEAALTSGAVEIAFRPLQPPVRDARLTTRSLWREAIVAVVRDDDPLVARTKVGIADLEGRALIGNPSGNRDEGGGFDLRRAAGDAADKLNVAYLTDQPTTLVALVRAAFGVGVISQLALATTKTEGLAVRPIDSPTAFRDVALFWDERDTSASKLAPFIEAVTSADPPPDVERIDSSGS